VKERLGLLVIVLLVVANIFLIPLAFENAQGPAVGARERSTSSTASPEPRRENPDNRTGAPSVDDAPMLMSSGGRLIVSSLRSSCGGDAAPQLRVSDDRGRSFRSVELDSKVTAVLALEVIGDDRVLVVAADKACRTVAFESRDRGKSWDAVDPKGRWHLDRSLNAKRVLSPNGPLTTPCAPITLSQVRNDVVRLLCPDGRILRAPDDQQWTVVGRLKGAVTIRFPVPEVGFALAPQGKCDAAALRSTDSGATWERLACLQGQRPLAISGQDGEYAALVDENVEISDDRGETWRSP